MDLLFFFFFLIPFLFDFFLATGDFRTGPHWFLWFRWQIITLADSISWRWLTDGGNTYYWSGFGPQSRWFFPLILFSSSLRHFRIRAPASWYRVGRLVSSGWNATREEWQLPSFMVLVLSCLTRDMIQGLTFSIFLDCQREDQYYELVSLLSSKMFWVFIVRFLDWL